MCLALVGCKEETPEIPNYELLVEIKHDSTYLEEINDKYDYKFVIIDSYEDYDKYLIEQDNIEKINNVDNNFFNDYIIIAYKYSFNFYEINANASLAEIYITDNTLNFSMEVHENTSILDETKLIYNHYYLYKFDRQILNKISHLRSYFFSR